MPVITFDRFDLGIDHRKGASVSDANRLVEMKNAHVTTGLATEKRPGLTHVARLESGTKGLFAANGKLNTFYCGSNTITHADPLFLANKQTSTTYSNVALKDVPFVDLFNGQFYVAATHTNNHTRHYFNGAEVTDSNCPHTGACLKAASKIFAVGKDGSTVRFSKTGYPTDWSASNDAGFLPTGLNSRGAREARALGLYQNRLAVLMRDGAQVWTVDPDPTRMGLSDVVENVGTSFGGSLATVAGDLYFLSDYGFRSITTMQLIAKLSDVDIGSPIDDLVRPAVRNRGSSIPRAVYFYGTGKYLCAIGSQVFVYSVSRTAKIAAWSRYEFPVAVEAWTELEGVLYLRSGNDVYKLDEDSYVDEVVNSGGTKTVQRFEVLVQMPWMNFKKPGVLKHVTGLDISMAGECLLSIGTDDRYPDAFTDECRIVGNTYSGGIIPFECMGNAFSFRFRNQTDGPFRLDALSVYHENLGVY